MEHLHGQKPDLASATAAVALTFSASEFTGGFEAAAKTAIQSGQLKTTPGNPNQPMGKPIGGPSAADGLKAPPHVDLYGVPYYPRDQKGMPGSWYCSEPLYGERSRSVVISVKNKGGKAAGYVAVQFHFSGGKTISQAVPVGSNPDALHRKYARIPTSAWVNGRASFTIRIDPRNQVAESNENNNVYAGFCLDPAYEPQNLQGAVN